ncbi:MAG TPA: polysaccharide pyruvyl transferase family protein, partial [Caproiciproducens sp.]|nr:polysaccharide pyruvyl transferase family protein [Caproiciproducens sp.]
LSQKTGLKIIYIHSGFKKPIRATYIRSAGPEEFVGYIVNAKYIITNSFHGMAFSIIFHKCFFVGLLKPPSQVNCRLENILDLFHLRNRQIVDGRNDFVDQGIDYIAIEHAIQREREKSVNYLKDVLGLQNE